MDKEPSGAEPYEKLILEHVGRPQYKPVKPKVILKKLGLSDDETRLFKKALKKLIRERRLRWGSAHQVIFNDRPPASAPPSSTLSRNPREPRDSDSPDTSFSPTTDRSTEGGPNRAESTGEDQRWWLPANVQMGVWGTEGGGRDSESPGKRRKTKAKAAQKRGEKKTSLHQMIGRFRRSPSGHGSVTATVLESTAGEAISQAFQAAPDERVFVRAPNSLDAATGDIVLVEYERKRRGTSSEWSGRVVEILRRRTNRFVGTYWINQGTGCVTVDGGQFPQSVLVGDASAKGVQADDKVVIEMVRFPSQYDFGQAVIVEVLGPPGQTQLDTIMIMRQFDLVDEFPEPVLQAAREQAAAFLPEVQGSRRDLTSETIVTIDPLDARDFDDAISLRRLENGHWQLGVHIADVSHFVPAGSPLDREAYRRGTSVYLPNKVIPMLPEIISNHLASLQPDQLRFAMSVEIEFTATGQWVHTEFFRSGIRSVRRFTYEEVDEYLADREGWRERLSPAVHRLLADMHELAMLLRRKRFENGSLEMMLPEVKLDLDREGQVVGAKTTVNTESHQIIEEFMLMANVAIATRLSDLGYHVLRRIHAPPSLRRLSELTQFVKELGIPVESLQDRFEIKRVLEETADSPLRHAVHYAVLRAMQKATYGPKEVGHFALNFPQYCHFTSPIRRYPDLVIHRMLGDLIDGARPNAPFDWLTIVGEHCSDREQNAEQAERELVKLKLLTYFAQKIGQEMLGVITGVESFGLFVQGTEIPAEGLVTLANMPEDQYFYDDRARMLMGRSSRHQFRLGDQVLVKIHRVDLVRRQLDLRLIESRVDGSAPRAESRPTKSRSERSAEGRSRAPSTNKGRKKK